MSGNLFADGSLGNSFPRSPKFAKHWFSMRSFFCNGGSLCRTCVDPTFDNLQAAANMNGSYVKMSDLRFACAPCFKGIRHDKGSLVIVVVVAQTVR